MSKGRIYQIVCHLEERHTPFAVSRLIMVSGVSVRKFGPDSDDNSQVLAKIRMALRSILKEPDLQRMQYLFEEQEESAFHEKLASGGRS